MEIYNSLLLSKDGKLTVINSDPAHAVSICCPHCQRFGTFPTLSQGIRVTDKNAQGNTTYRDTFIRSCPNTSCKGLIFTVSENKHVLICMPAEEIDFETDAIPPSLVQTMAEAIKCHSVGAHRASALMVRRMLEELCEDSGATGKNLFERLKSLKSKVTLPEDLFDAMDALKALGNDAAHVESKAYANIGAEEAELSIELGKEILKSRYQLKNIVDRLKARKKP